MKKLALAIPFIVGTLLLVSMAIAFTDAERPTTQGYYSEWAYSNCTYGYECVDESFPDTGDYITTSSGSKSDSWKIDTSLNDSLSIHNVSLMYYAKWVGLRDRNVVPFVRINNTDYFGDVIALSSSWGYVGYTFDENPATESEWEPSDLNDLEFGIKSHYLRGGGEVAQAFVNVEYSF